MSLRPLFSTFNIPLSLKSLHCSFLPVSFCQLSAHMHNVFSGVAVLFLLPRYISPKSSTPSTNAWTASGSLHLFPQITHMYTPAPVDAGRVADYHFVYLISELVLLVTHWGKYLPCSHYKNTPIKQEAVFLSCSNQFFHWIKKNIISLKEWSMLSQMFLQISHSLIPCRYVGILFTDLSSVTQTCIPRCVYNQQTRGNGFPFLLEHINRALANVQRSIWVQISSLEIVANVPAFEDELY